MFFLWFKYCDSVDTDVIPGDIASSIIQHTSGTAVTRLQTCAWFSQQTHLN